MAAYWTNFAKTGDPNGEGLPEWPAFASSRQSALLIGEDIRAGEIPNHANLAAIDRLYGAVRVVLKYGALIAGATVLAVLALLWWLASTLLLRREATA